MSLAYGGFKSRLAGYDELLSKVVARLPRTTPDSRRDVGEGARAVPEKHLRGQEPPADEDVVGERALTEAIDHAEAGQSASNPQSPVSQGAETPNDHKSWLSEILARASRGDSLELEPQQPPQPASSPTPLTRDPAASAQTPTKDSVVARVSAVADLMKTPRNQGSDARASRGDSLELEPQRPLRPASSPTRLSRDPAASAQTPTKESVVAPVSAVADLLKTPRNLGSDARVAPPSRLFPQSQGAGKSAPFALQSQSSFLPPQLESMRGAMSAKGLQERKPVPRPDDLKRVLGKLHDDSPGVEASALISEDGLMIASALAPNMEETRVAGMTAQLQNLCSRAARELARGTIREVIIRGERGYTILISAGRGAVLLALANETSKLGLIFFDMHEAIKTLQKVL